MTLNKVAMNNNKHTNAIVMDKEMVSASGNSALGHPQHRGGDSFACCTERYEMVVY